MGGPGKGLRTKGRGTVLSALGGGEGYSAHSVGSKRARKRERDRDRGGSGILG